MNQVRIAGGPGMLAMNASGVMARFFISHSADDGSHAQAVLLAIADELRHSGHDVFVDSQIRPGERWRPRIYDELAKCDAAIVLLDDAALRSWWVRREVYNLLWRRHLGSVQIRGVLIGEVTPSSLRKNGLGELVELQLIVERNQRTGKPDVANLLSSEFTAFANGESGEMRRWIGELSEIIQKADVGDALERFAESLGLSKTETFELFDQARYKFLAHQLLGRPDPPSNTFRAVASIEHVIGRDGTFALARRAAPALIDGESAWWLVQCNQDHNEFTKRTFVLNADLSQTSELYVMRASCCAKTFRHVAISSSATGEKLEEDLLIQSEYAVAKLLHIRGDVTTNRVQRKLADYRPGTGGIVEAGYLAIEGAAHQIPRIMTVVGRIQSKYPWLAIILLTGQTVPTAFIDQYSEVTKLLDKMPPGREDDVDQALNALSELARAEILGA